MPTVGLIINGVDKASAVIGAIGSNATSAFKTAGNAVIVFNQAAALGRKALNLFRNTIGDALEASLKFRAANDPAVTAFRRMREEADQLKARLGDVLMPIAVGLAKAFNGVGNSVVDWINANRKLIATNLADWLRDIAELSVKGVAFGALQISRAWSGWLEIVNLSRAAIETMFGAAIKGAAGLVSGLSALGIVNEKVADDMRLMGEVFDESAGEHIAKVEAQVAAQEKLEEQIKNGFGVALKFVGEAHAKVMESIATSTTGAIVTTDQLVEAQKRLLATANMRYALEAKIEAGMQEIHMNNLQRAADFESVILAQQESQRQAYAQTAETIASTWGGAFETMLTDSDSAGKAMRGAAITTAKTIIMTAAATAAAEQLKAHSFIPFVGIAVGSAFAAAIFGAVLAYSNKFQFGGVVRGGVPGRDSVPAMLTPGERVLTQRENAEYERRGRENSAMGRSVNQTLVIRSDTPPTDTDYRRAVRRLAKENRILVRRGLVGAF